MPKRSCPKLTCKPKALHVGPLGAKSNYNVPLLHEELEALYLADVKGMYHEACAEAMEISRPTFTKLLKSARRKCASVFLQAQSLRVDLKPLKLRAIFPSEDGKTMSDRFQSARYFVSIVWDEFEIVTESIIKNPIYEKMLASGTHPIGDEQAKGLGAGRLIPPLLENASIVCALQMGEGMERNIIGMGPTVQILPKSAHNELLRVLVEKLG